jgi:hypothetical protein
MDDAFRAQSALRLQKGTTRRKSVARKIRESILSQAASELIEAQQGNGGRLPHKKMCEVIQALADNGFHATRYSLNHAMKMKAKRSLPGVLEPTDSLPVLEPTSIVRKRDEVSYKDLQIGTNKTAGITCSTRRTRKTPRCQKESRRFEQDALLSFAARRQLYHHMLPTMKRSLNFLSSSRKKFQFCRIWLSKSSLLRILKAALLYRSGFENYTNKCDRRPK